MKIPKTLKSVERNVNNPMKKRGQTIELVGIVLIIGIVIIGTSAVYFHKDSLFFGDITNMNLYKYSECKEVINKIQKGNLKAFESQSKAEQEGFHLIRCD